MRTAVVEMLGFSAGLCELGGDGASVSKQAAHV